MKEIGDGVFSEKMVGDGLAIIPANETVCAPVSGKITVLMEDSKHAVGMTLSNGVEILIHVGIDTVSMGGKGFEYLCKVDTAVFVVTNPNGVEFKFNSGFECKTGEDVIASY